MIVEQPVHGLEAEVGHPHEVGVGEGQTNAHAVDVRLLHISHFAGKRLAGGTALFPESHFDGGETPPSTVYYPRAPPRPPHGMVTSGGAPGRPQRPAPIPVPTGG